MAHHVFKETIIQNVFKTTIEKDMTKTIHLKPIQYSYLTANGKCSDRKNYRCISKVVAEHLKGSSSQCSVVTLPDLQLCKINKTSDEEQEFWTALITAYNSNGCSTNYCTTLEYSGEETKYKKISTLTNNHMFAFIYHSSNSTTFYEEYWVYDGINAIGSVGGTLGMCIGFSFTGLISSLLNTLQHSIFYIKAKFGNSELSNQSLEIEKDAKQNEKKRKRLLRNEIIYLEERLYEKIYKKLEEKFDEKLKRSGEIQNLQEAI